MELRPYLDILKRHRWTIMRAVIAVAVVAGLLSSLRLPTYEATARVLLRPGDPGERLAPGAGRFPTDPDRWVVAQAGIVKSPQVAAEAAKSVRASASEIDRIVSVRQSQASDILEISATDVDPVRARDIANAVAKGYIENRRMNAVETLQRVIDDIDGRLTELQARIGELDTRIGHEGATPGASARLDSPANPSSPMPLPAEPVAGPEASGPATTKEALKAERYAAAVQYESLFSRQQELLVEKSLKRGEAELVSLADTPEAPTSPKPLRDTVLGALVGLLLGTAIVFLREQLDDRLHWTHEVERVTGLPILAELPYDESTKSDCALAAVARPVGALTEAVRSLRTSLQFLSVDKPLRIILVTSPLPGEGKSLVAANLAVVYAQAGYVTYLVSADLRRPRLAVLPDDAAPPSPGLTGVLAETAERRGPQPATAGNGQSGGALDKLQRLLSELEGTSVPGPGCHAPRVGGILAAVVPSSVPNLSVLPPGPTPLNPAELLGSRRMAEALDELAAAAEIVVVDTPPLLPVTDAAVLASKADGIVMVVALDETRRDAAIRAKTILDSTGTRVLGVVANKARAGRSYYGQYYAESSSERQRTWPRPTRRASRRAEERTGDRRERASGRAVRQEARVGDRATGVLRQRAAKQPGPPAPLESEAESGTAP